MLGRKLLNWINSQGLNVEILGEFDDAALMKAFGATHNAILLHLLCIRTISMPMILLLKLDA